MPPQVDYLLSVRDVRRDKFVADVGRTRFLEVTAGDGPDPKYAVATLDWYKHVTAAGEWTNDHGEARGDILFVVHGYNASVHNVMDRHRRLGDALAVLAFKGVIVSFSWPSADSAMDISNVKRLGVAPRVGRIGLPAGTPAQAVNVECTDNYAVLDADPAVQPADQPHGFVGSRSHSWYFGNAVFTKDLFDTVIGIENSPRAKHVLGLDGKLHLARVAG